MAAPADQALSNKPCRLLRANSCAVNTASTTCRRWEALRQLPQSAHGLQVDTNRVPPFELSPTQDASFPAQPYEQPAPQAPYFGTGKRADSFLEALTACK